MCWSLTLFVAERSKACSSTEKSQITLTCYITKTFKDRRLFPSKVFNVIYYLVLRNRKNRALSWILAMHS